MKAWTERFRRGCPHWSRRVRDGAHITAALFHSDNPTDFLTVHIYVSPDSTEITEATTVTRVT